MVRQAMEETEMGDHVELLTAEQVADLFGTTTGAVYTARSRGRAPFTAAVRVGKRLLWRRSDIEAWLDAQFDASTTA